MRPTHPSLYQINTRVWLTDISRRLGRQATLDDIPDESLDRSADLGFDWIWFLGVWQTGTVGARISRSNPEWRHEFQHTLPDLKDEDIAGSCFAITAYEVPADRGGDAALARLRQRLNDRGLRLMLDFVPNHTALDHPWMWLHPEYYVVGSEDQLRDEPHNYGRFGGGGRAPIVAYGRDPYFPGWPDTAQLDYSNPATHRAMRAELARVAARCDGVRCDMAMLLLPHVFERTWGVRGPPFWPVAIDEVKRRYPKFVFMAEVYWDLEWTLQQQGFDFTYDKRLYDRLREGRAEPVCDHLRAGLEYQNRLARFIENHDEPRAAAVFPPDQHKAVAIVTFLSPGLRFVHDGQIEGRTHRISPHLVRAPVEAVDAALRDFYLELLGVLHHPAVRQGEWQLLDVVPAWSGNDSYRCLLVWAWHTPNERLLVAVNVASHASQGFVRLPFIEASPMEYLFSDLTSTANYVRPADDLATRGLYLDMPAWGYHVFRVSSKSPLDREQRSVAFETTLNG